MQRWRVGWSALIFVIGYCVLAWLVPQKPLMQFLNILVLSISVAVVATYAPAWVQTLRKENLDGPDALSLGIGCTWTAEIGQRIWSIIWRGLDKPDWMTTSPILPFFLALTVLGGVQHITAPGAVNGVVPKRGWSILGVSLGVATLLALLVAVYGFRDHRSSGWFSPQDHQGAHATPGPHHGSADSDYSVLPGRTLSWRLLGW